jgi:histidinol dehydrogenase
VNLRILDWDALDEPARRAALARPTIATRASVEQGVRNIVDEVRERGDAAVRDCTAHFDGVHLDSLAVSPKEIDAAYDALSRNQIAALERAIANVTTFHAAQIPDALSVETMPGVRCERIVRPIDSVGLYVPAGSAALPSAVVMLAVPARLAGCPRRALCTPPAKDGRPNSAVLAAARLCGVEEIYRIGGAQAIAALAFGTESVPKVDKLFGPGNAWVTAAKRLVATEPGGAACDMPAGPSEVMVIADETANAALVASDLLAQAEHDALSQAILVTPSSELARSVSHSVAQQAQALSRQSILEGSLAMSRCLVVRDLAAAMDVANAYAAEHLMLHVADARRWLPAIRNAGSIFLGEWSPEPFGDYCSGTNHVLPTYGHARAYSGLSVLDFLKRITVQEITSDGLRALAPTAIALAELEGLDAHAAAVAKRLELLRGLAS